MKTLEKAEQHHAQMTQNFGYVLAKLRTIGGKHYDDLSLVVNDMADRVDAAHRRVLNLESKIMEG